MAKVPDYVKVLDTAHGKRYEVRIEVGGADGTRKQKRRRFPRLQEAIDAYAESRGDRSRGVQVSPTELTVRQAVDNYLDALDIRPTTRSGYAHRLRPVVAVLGDKTVQSVRREDIEKLVRDLKAGGVRSCDWRKPLKLRKAVTDETLPWKASTINPMLGRLTAVWERLVLDGTVTRNVVALVDRVPAEKFEHRTLTVDEVRQLYRSLREDRLEHLHQLALHGLRRGELAGLRWSDMGLDGDAPSMQIRHQRLHSDDGVLDDVATKTEASERVLPIPSDLVAVLRRARIRSRAEQLAVGSKWVGTGHAIHSEFGAPYYPTTLNDLWHGALKAAKLPRVRLHDARHTCGTLMHLDGVPIAVIAAWLGHVDASFTQRTYAHSQPGALREAAEAYGKAVHRPERKGAR